MISSLSSWQNFYVIVGSATGALTGLQFVVVTLVTQARAALSMREIRAFGTPTEVHFCSALPVSALMSAPWPSTETFGTCLGICGLVGVIYSLGIIWHARKATYNPDLEDWIWYTVLPLAAHLALVAAAVMLWWHDCWPLYIVAAATLGFLLVGVHNSWDTVTYIALKHSSKLNETSTQGKDQGPT